ncbi:DNA methylase [Vibrio phage qdvp001]|uniref:DNA methylase n=1 Tax=Vibrio phage qdvp001 TaxID=1003177 RepID=UPI00072142F5|nr:DNA methylase [Vibrio phage qdvp001]ALM62012.1 DNA methylase [Vibrio phage qdvp001]
MIIIKDNGTRHQLINADCLSLDLNDIMDKTVFDLVLTDLPFGITQAKWDSVIDLEKMWKWLPLFTYENTPILLFAQTPFDKVLGSSNIRNLKYEWIWEKTAATGHLNAKKAPMKSHENILVFYKKLPLYNPQKTTGHKPANTYTKHTGDGELYGKTKLGISGGKQTDRYPRDVLKFASDKQKLNIHSTQKPLELLRYMIRTYTNEGDTVLDFTAGSCSVAVAAYLEGRNSVCIEMDTEQYNKSVEWVKNCSFDEPYKVDNS